ncbi:MAG: hypothetical protein JWM32_215 [Verrucomicrobia bacterium]|nr:hypothetical protein [Verrucomicrobiota bacterium]
MNAIPAPADSQRLSPDDVISRLKRLQAFEIQSARLLGGWLPGVERWEIKHEIALHLWQDAQHSRELRTRLWELRVMNPDRAPDPAVAKVIAGLACAQADYEFLAGHYLVFKAELVAAYHSIVANIHKVYDAPTIAIIQRLLPEKEAQLKWARRELPALQDSGEKQRQASRWTAWIRMLLGQVGGIAGTEPVTGAEAVPPPGSSCPLPFPGALRDSRFKLSESGMAMPDENDTEAKVLFQFFNYSQEMQAAETLGSILWETAGMEWDFYYDIARHCYDEERHSALGESRLRQLGHHVTDFPNCVANYAWRQLYDPLRRYTALTYVIEADGFKYKHETYQEHMKNGDTESAQAVLYDIIDETNHVRFGQKWVPKMMANGGYGEPLEKLVAECRDIVVSHSTSALQRAFAIQHRKAGSAPTSAAME